MFSSYDGAKIIEFVLKYLDTNPRSIWKLYWQDMGKNNFYRIYRTQNMFFSNLIPEETVLQIRVVQPDHIEFRLATWREIKELGNMGGSVWRQIINIAQFLMALHKVNGDEDYYWFHKSKFQSFTHYWWNKPTYHELNDYGKMHNPNVHLSHNSSRLPLPALYYVHQTKTIEEFLSKHSLTNGQRVFK